MKHYFIIGLNAPDHKSAYQMYDIANNVLTEVRVNDITGEIQCYVYRDLLPGHLTAQLAHWQQRAAEDDGNVKVINEKTFWGVWL
jgi:hypothetical protein